MKNFNHYINSNLKHLYKDLKNQIILNEQKFTKKPKYESFLWEHTKQVAVMAFHIAEKEKVEPFLPVVVALFHDSGKFLNGEYHTNDITEEKSSVKVARKILKKNHFNENLIENVANSLLALYNEDIDKTIVSNIVHDSDFLVKFGFTGITTLFQKATLRGMTLETTALKTFSKEYTYAINLEKNMRTETGKLIAEGKSKQHIEFLDNLINELNIYYNFNLRKLVQTLPCPKDENELIPYILVFSEFCKQCNDKLTLTNTIEKGLKCTKLISTFICNQGHFENEISFCLPELCGKSEVLTTPFVQGHKEHRGKV